MGNASATEACSVRAPPLEAFEALEVETFFLDFFLSQPRRTRVCRASSRRRHDQVQLMHVTAGGSEDGMRSGTIDTPCRAETYLSNLAN